MGLRTLANGMLQGINPDIVGNIYLNQGATTGYGGKRTPGYLLVPGRSLQVQAMSYGAMRRAEALNFQGVKRQVFLDGYVAGVGAWPARAAISWVSRAHTGWWWTCSRSGTQAIR